MSATSGSNQIVSALLPGSFSPSSSLSSGKVEVDQERKVRINDSLKNLQEGDMIQIERSSFLHYVIYVGNDKIVDLVADNNGQVTCRDLFQTVGDCNCVVDNYLDKNFTPFPQDEIVKRAMFAMRDNHLYDICSYNCQHFATWCRYGIKDCKQIKMTKEKVQKGVEMAYASST